MAQYTQKELLKLFDTLPDELKQAILAVETAERIRSACQRNGLKEEEVSIVAALTGDILMGLLPPDKLSEKLQEELEINKETAENISREITRFVLFPVKASLAEFYKEITFAPGGRMLEKTEETSKRETEKPKGTTDIYREPIE